MKKLTQAEIAKKLGISRQYLNGILRGKVRPGVKLAGKIAEELNISFFKLRPDLKDLIKKYL